MNVLHRLAHGIDRSYQPVIMVFWGFSFCKRYLILLKASNYNGKGAWKMYLRVGLLWERYYNHSKAIAKIQYLAKLNTSSEISRHSF